LRLGWGLSRHRHLGRRRKALRRGHRDSGSIRSTDQRLPDRASGMPGGLAPGQRDRRRVRL